MSEHLGRAGITHLVLERSRIAERWRRLGFAGRQHDRFPGMEFDAAPDAFVAKDKVADYFAAYAKKIAAPIRCGTEVTELRRNAGRPGFTVTTSRGSIEANNVVVATGPFQKPIIPAVIPASPRCIQRLSQPGQLPPGAVLVIGGEAHRACRSPMSCSSQAARSICRSAPMTARRALSRPGFLLVAGGFGQMGHGAPRPGTHVTISVSGAHGGETIDFRRLGNRGMTLLGRTEGYRDGALHFRPRPCAESGCGGRGVHLASRPTPISPITALTCPRSPGPPSRARPRLRDPPGAGILAF